MRAAIIFSFSRATLCIYMKSYLLCTHMHALQINKSPLPLWHEAGIVCPRPIIVLRWCENIPTAWYCSNWIFQNMVYCLSSTSLASYRYHCLHINTTPKNSGRPWISVGRSRVHYSHALFRHLPAVLWVLGCYSWLSQWTKQLSGQLLPVYLTIKPSTGTCDLITQYFPRNKNMSKDNRWVRFQFPLWVQTIFCDPISEQHLEPFIFPLLVFFF